MIGIRNTVFTFACAALCASALPHAARADSYPEKPVRVVLPYPAGGGGDVIGRPLAQKLSERFRRQFVIDNRGGASGNIGMEIVATAPPDGYTLLLALAAQLAVNQALYSKLPYDAMRDYAPISLLASAPYFLEVHPTVPVTTLAEFIKLAHAQPGKLVYGSSGNGGGPHLSMELLRSMAKLDLVHVPYKGAGPALPALLAGEVKVMFASYGISGQHVRAGRLRALAVSSTRRATTMPEVPTIAEAGVPGYDSGVWYAMLAPKGTPPAIIKVLNTEIVSLLKSSDLNKHLAGDGLDTIGSTPEQLSAYMKTETKKWTEVVKRSGARID